MGGGGPFWPIQMCRIVKERKMIKGKRIRRRQAPVGWVTPWAGNKYLSSREEDGQTCAHSNEGRSTLFSACALSRLFSIFEGGPRYHDGPGKRNKMYCIFFFFLIGRRTFFSRVARQTVCLHHNKRYAGEKATEFKFHQWLEQKNAGGVIITPPTHCVSVDNIARATNSLTVFSLLRPASRR